MKEVAQLVRFDRPACAPAQGTLVAIHDDGADVEELLDWCVETAPRWDVCAPRAPRSRNPFQTGGAMSLAPVSVQHYRGFCWIRRDPDGRTDPTSLGDALVELADLLSEVKRRDPNKPIVVIGQGTGGALARQLACRTRSVLYSVIAIDASPLRIVGFDDAPLSTVPVWDVVGRRTARDRLLSIDG